jgi:hypothetical protein
VTGSKNGKAADVRKITAEQAAQLKGRKFDPMPSDFLTRRAEAFAIATSTAPERGGCKPADGTFGNKAKPKRGET